ncbi:hypothetical protein W02_07220 [Nitrospira sp. KM1]|nr:hypothetical protein W02_07220 [Nitrospira sp. KM1]
MVKLNGGCEGELTLAESVAVIVTEYGEAVDVPTPGIPVISPAVGPDGLMERPDGRPVALQVYGGVPPLADMLNA